MTPLRDLMATVGYLILYWGITEQALSTAIGKLGGDTARAPRLTDWEAAHAVLAAGNRHHMAEVRAVVALLEPARRMRNAISHGLTSAQGNPEGASLSWVICRTTDGEVTYSKLEIEEETLRLEQTRGAIERLTGAALRLNAPAGATNQSGARA